MMSDHTRRMYRESAHGNDNEANPVGITIDRLNAMADERHAWLSVAAAQIAAWKAEDAANGQPWGEDV